MIHAINNYIMVRRDQVRSPNMIHIPDIANHSQFYATLVSAGPMAHRSLVSGDKLLIKWNQRAEAIKHEGKDYYFFLDTDVALVKKGPTWHPIGNQVLVKRLNDEKQVGSLIIPALYRSQDQTLDSIFIRAGMKTPFEKNETPMIPGDYVRLLKWDQKMTEVDIDGHYYLVVPNSLLLYYEKTDEPTS